MRAGGSSQPVKPSRVIEIKSGRTPELTRVLNEKDTRYTLVVLTRPFFIAGEEVLI
jgi:hypothetical protein